MTLTVAAVESALRSLQDPNTQQDYVTSKAARNIRVDGNDVSLDVELGYPAKSQIDLIRKSVIEALKALPGVGNVSANVYSKIVSHTVQRGIKLLPGVKNIIAVASGKGGVGKSTTAVNLALALAQEGATVGILDADIYGPSQPQLLGLSGRQPESKDGNSLEPLEAYGLQAMPTRNNYGIIGPIPKSEFKWENIQKKIAAHPFAKEAKGKPRVLTITQSTYDGVIYNVEAIKSELDGKIDTLHFDEAWLPHATFHDFYKGMHAIGKDRPRCKESMVFSTQSTHKLLAGLSQASQILVQDSKTRKLDRHSFNEAFLMHTSTSPQYAIIASCDVAAAM